tara:strand:+ start:127 stop:522 length:396 start_codon:yes stop_codon:yes gene_type:complete
MGRKPKQYKYVKDNDGRRNNGRKKGVRNIDVLKATPSSINKAKQNRITIHTLNAITKIYGSEQGFWEDIADKAQKGSFPHAKLLASYRFGNPSDIVNENSKEVSINIKNLFTGNQDETIDLDEETTTEQEI